MKTARFFCRLAVVLSTIAASPAMAQMSFATRADAAPTAPSGTTATGSPYGSGAMPTSPSPPATYPSLSSPPSGMSSPPAFGTSSPPTGMSAPPSTYVPSGSVPYSQPYVPPNAPGYAPAGVGAAPVGTPGMMAQPSASPWDPFAAPGPPPGQSTLLQQDPCLPASTVTMGTMQKFLQHVNFEYAWFAGHGDRQLGINDLDLNATFAFPLFFNPATPLLVTPGFGVHYWQGPISLPQLTPEDPLPADLPPQTFDAYLDFAWNPWPTEFFGAELNFRTGIYSDFYRVTSDAFRFMGKGMIVVKLSPSMTLKAGVWYLDRVRVKILPAGGLVWQPSPDFYCDILFPNPRIAKKLNFGGTTEWWVYGSGEYGGGSWTIRRDSGLTPPSPVDGTYTRVDYNDIRIALGLQFKTQPRQLEGYFEVGLSCSRELVYADLSPDGYFPRNTVYIGAGLTY